MTGEFLPECDCKELVAGQHVPLLIDRDDDGPPGWAEVNRAGDLVNLRGRTFLQERHMIADKEEHPEIFRAEVIPLSPDMEMHTTFITAQDLAAAYAVMRSPSCGKS